MDAEDFLGLVIVCIVAAMVLGVTALLLKWLGALFLFLWAL